VPYGGGGPRGASAIEDVVKLWVKLNACTGDPTVTQSGITTISTWSRCKARSAVRFEKIEGAVHTWYGSGSDAVPGEPNANVEITNFFNSLPPRT
jgi:poly(3-hydroxybutyrate) depolymerase